MCVRRCFEVSEPSRQKKWVTIKQEVTWTQGKGGGEIGSGYLFLLFSTLCRGLTWQSNVSELGFSSIS